jgi:Transcriptional regulator, AbiEi antitoxin, Type IV TA system/Transcriptional regulator, AbiEi antitoxin N-terminal domain
MVYTCTMGSQRHGKINHLVKRLPEGLPVDAAWLRAEGYTPNLLRKYEAAGWLAQPAHRIYIRPRGPIAWQQAVIALQTLLGKDLVIGGRTALDLHGFSHYLETSTQAVYLYGPQRPPTWLKDLPAGVEFRTRNDARIFTFALASTAPHQLETSVDERVKRSDGAMTMPWGSWHWPLTVSTPERAILEFLDELPDRESFHQADVLMEGLSTLSPVRLQALLVDCHNIKVKRLFFFFADRHAHAWLKRLNRGAIDLGRGKRSLVKGGRYDAKHMITVPEDLDAVG